MSKWKWSLQGKGHEVMTQDDALGLRGFGGCLMVLPRKCPDSAMWGPLSVQPPNKKWLFLQKRLEHEKEDKWEVEEQGYENKGGEDVRDGEKR